MQKEAADRFIGTPTLTQISLMISFYYDVAIYRYLESSDFSPTPGVRVVVLSMQRNSRKYNKDSYNLFRDFVSYVFNSFAPNMSTKIKSLLTSKQLKRLNREFSQKLNLKPAQLARVDFDLLFGLFESNGEKYHQKVRGEFNKWEQAHSNVEKLTRY